MANSIGDMSIEQYFTNSYRSGGFDRLVNGAGIFELGAEDRRNFPALKEFRLLVVRRYETSFAVTLER